ncbi:hypothetical protein C9374_008668 [Naegleria lovaniensis]|uniref:Phospholipase/carboxylesterase/thioesterase domain-containing protein n=1 Tax=Naegleria lovaniensis TaxID=51637 RepID=A0AA88GIX3_NAELO|nr:uncharacterized protein C9374_008668 [Naegleria lovaniensis]KAG2378046.1 hypothetical protein C9374_008668 [Naegleria lovaniensis]
MGQIVSQYVFAPPKPTYDEHHPYPVTFLTTKSKKMIPCYYMKANKDTPTTIIYSHGNAADIGAMFDFLVVLRDYLNVNVLHYEYVGYGLANQYQPSESDTYESAEAAYEYLTKAQKVNPKDIVIFGTSVGSGPSCYLANKYPIKGLILECPFVSICRIVSQSVFLRPVDMFCNINRIPNVKAPVIIFHGTNDDVVPYDHGKELYSNVQKQYQYKFISIENGSHHDIIERLTLKTYIQTLRGFLAYLDNSNQEKPSQ